MNKNTEWVKERVKSWEVTFEVDGEEMRYAEIGPCEMVTAGRAAARLQMRYGASLQFISIREIEA